MAQTRVEQHLRAGGGRLVGRRRGVVVAAVGLVLVALIGLGSARSLWQVGGPPRLISPHSYAGDLIVVAFGLLAVSPLVVSALRGRPAGPRIRRPRVPRWGQALVALAVVASVLAVLLVMRLVAGSGAPPRQGGGIGPQRPPGVVAPSPLAGSSDHSGPLGLPSVQLWGLVAFALAVLAAIAFWLRLREPPLPPMGDAEDDSSELLAAVDLSLSDLDQEPDPRRAVIRAYARMEGALGLHGLARRPSETPLEYLARALASLRVGRASVERLTALFERAKFSAHDIDGSMKADALAALRALRDELAEPTA
jgi:hypothetical protein